MQVTIGSVNIGYGMGSILSEIFNLIGRYRLRCDAPVRWMGMPV